MLPSSLTRVLSLALVCSTYPPVSVCGTGEKASSLRGFSRQSIRPLLPVSPGFALRHRHPSAGGSPGLRPHFAPPPRGRNINRLSIGYAIWPRLRPASPDADEPSVGNLRYSANVILTHFSLLMPTFSLDGAPVRFPLHLRCALNAPLPHHSAVGARHKAARADPQPPQGILAGAAAASSLPPASCLLPTGSHGLGGGL